MAPVNGKPNLHKPRAEVGAKATRVKNEGAFPPADARTYRSEEGSDEVTLMPPPHRRGGGLARLKNIG